MSNYAYCVYFLGTSFLMPSNLSISESKSLYQVFGWHTRPLSTNSIKLKFDNYIGIFIIFLSNNAS